MEIRNGCPPLSLQFNICSKAKKKGVRIGKEEKRSLLADDIHFLRSTSVCR